MGCFLYLNCLFWGISFFFVFPHKKLLAEEFYEKYDKNPQDITLLENIKLYLTDFYYFCFTDYYSAKGSFLLLFYITF